MARLIRPLLRTTAAADQVGNMWPINRLSPAQPRPDQQRCRTTGSRRRGRPAAFGCGHLLVALRTHCGRPICMRRSRVPPVKAAAVALAGELSAVGRPERGGTSWLLDGLGRDLTRRKLCDGTFFCVAVVLAGSFKVRRGFRSFLLASTRRARIRVSPKSS